MENSQDRLRVLIPPTLQHYFLIASLAAIAWVSDLLLVDGPLRWAGLGVALVLSWAVVIDLTRLRLPDVLTLFLLLSAIVFTALFRSGFLMNALIGAILGYGAIAALRWVYLRLRGQEGIGLGDAKLLAACGAWAGGTSLPFILLVASLSSIIWVVVQHALTGEKINKTPFGPGIAFGFWIVWLLGPVEIVSN